MKKTLSLFIILFMIFGIISYTNASNYSNEPYTFELEYQGTVLINETKEVDVKLIGVSGPPYTNALIEIDIDGPGTPKLLATDTNGTEIDIAQMGYWGPQTGFAVGGDFVNTTPVKATFDTAGTYEITLSLVDVSSGNAIITKRDFVVEVLGEEPIVEENNIIEELPETGIGIFEYIFYAAIVIAVIAIIYAIIRKKNNEN